jgi:hypothetical protein
MGMVVVVRGAGYGSRWRFGHDQNASCFPVNIALKTI